jgi:hypothetical protein
LVRCSRTSFCDDRVVKTSVLVTSSAATAEALARIQFLRRGGNYDRRPKERVVGPR